MKRNILYPALALLTLEVGAQTFTIPHSFSSGSTISSSEMNANFTSIENFVNANLCKSNGINCPDFGTVTSITTGTGLVPVNITNSGTIAVDVGTSANKIVQLDSTGRLPALDGSLLTNLNASNLFGSLPALDGSLLANITPSNLNGPVPIAKGGTGATTPNQAPSSISGSPGRLTPPLFISSQKKSV